MVNAILLDVFLDYQDFREVKDLSCYWAKFEKRDNNIFRFDTRVYLNDRNDPTDKDPCIGAIVGKNPGSALPSNLNSTVIQKIVLDRDQLLPNIRSIFQKAYNLSGKEIESNSYIQVLNLMYICDNNLLEAIHKNKKYASEIICEAEKAQFPFVWYVWGGDKALNCYKSRFNTLKTNIHFYFDTKANTVISKNPGQDNHARHTQGLTHDLIVPYISSIL